ncbi:MAG: hypothetical protein H0Z33_15410 [Bacillaceae bacterium]|nr:hypothetical protein [Bacillaceae bacterium]
MKISRQKMNRIRRKVAGMKGRTFTVSMGGNQYRAMIKGVKGDKVHIKARRASGKGVQQFGGGFFSFLLPLLFFLPLFGDDFDFFD